MGAGDGGVPAPVARRMYGDIQRLTGEKAALLRRLAMVEVRTVLPVMTVWPCAVLGIILLTLRAHALSLSQAQGRSDASPQASPVRSIASPLRPPSAASAGVGSGYGAGGAESLPTDDSDAADVGSTAGAVVRDAERDAAKDALLRKVYAELRRVVEEKAALVHVVAGLEARLS